MTDVILRHGRSPQRHILSSTEQAADRHVAALLSLPVGHPVCRMRSLRKVDGQPVSVATYFYPLPRFTGIAEVDHRGRLDLEVACGLWCDQGDAQPDPRACIAAVGVEANALQVGRGKPLIDLISVNRDQAGVPGAVCAKQDGVRIWTSSSCSAIEQALFQRHHDRVVVEALRFAACFGRDDMRGKGFADEAEIDAPLASRCSWRCSLQRRPRRPFRRGRQQQASTKPPRRATRPTPAGCTGDNRIGFAAGQEIEVAQRIALSGTGASAASEAELWSPGWVPLKAGPSKRARAWISSVTSS